MLAQVTAVAHINDRFQVMCKMQFTFISGEIFLVFLKYAPTFLCERWKIRTAIR